MSDATISQSEYDQLKKDLQKANEISDLRAQLLRKDEEIRRKDEEIKMKDEEIRRKDEEIKKKDEIRKKDEIKDKEKAVQNVYLNTRSEVEKRAIWSRLTVLHAIQKKIEMFAKLCAPDLIDQESLPDSTLGTIKNTRERLWKIILSRTDDPRIKRLNQQLEYAKIPRAVFCATVDCLSCLGTRYTGMGVKNLSTFGKKSVEDHLKGILHTDDPTTIRCVTEILYYL